jgi:hypothetical protein
MAFSDVSSVGCSTVRTKQFEALLRLESQFCGICLRGQFPYTQEKKRSGAIAPAGGGTDVPAALSSVLLNAGVCVLTSVYDFRSSSRRLQIAV